VSLVITDAPQEPVWRVGYCPEPLAWSGWEHATDGRFHGRWDDPEGKFRTLYLGESLLACLLEVLAFARKDKHLAATLAEIDEDPKDAQQYPTADPGALDPAWLGPRCAASAVLSGRYCRVTAADTVAALYPKFIGDALDAGYDDFDAALLKNSGARTITQAVSAHLYVQESVDGIQFGSRHGDELNLWCVYEQPHDSRISSHLLSLTEVALTLDTPELQQALEMLGLRWASTA
jgi:hypothetical protein